MKKMNIVLIKFIAVLLIFISSSVYSDNHEIKCKITSPIKGIVKLAPDNTIRDVFYDTVWLRVRVNELIWGNNFPTGPLDSLYFSVNDSKQWNKGRIHRVQEDPPNPAYEITSSAKVLLDQDVNHIYFYARWPDPSNQDYFYDTLVTFQVIYTKPTITIVDIYSFGFNPDITTVVNHPGNVPVTIKVQSTSNTTPPGTFERIIRLEAKKKEHTSWKTLWENTNGVVDTIYNFIWNDHFSSFNPGMNIIEFRSKGRCEAPPSCQEYSDVYSAKVFYLDLDYGEVIDSLFIEDTLKKFQGIPSGGYFTGPGIIEKTGYFNPLLAGVGIHTVKYNYLVEDSIHPIEKQVNVVAAPVLSQGKQEVCRNEHVYYAIGGTANMNVEMEVQGGGLKKDTNNSGWIHWDGNNAANQEYNEQLGKITVNLTQNDYSYQHQYLVDITETPTPDSTLIVLINNDLLVCSYADASFYVWVRNGIVIDTTLVPYYYFPDGKDLQTGDQLWVETAYSTGAFPCFTPSSVLEIQNSTHKNSVGVIEIFPNPCKAFATIQINQNDDYDRIELIDMYGRIRYSDSDLNLLNHQKLSFDCSRFEKGVYILRLIGKNGYYTKKVFIEN